VLADLARKGEARCRELGGSLREAIDFYVEHMLKINKSSSVAAVYAYACEVFEQRIKNGQNGKDHFTNGKKAFNKFLPVFGERNVATLTLPELTAWGAALPQTISSQNRILACIRSAFTIAKDGGLIPNNPLDGLKKFSLPASDVEFLSIEQTESFLRSLPVEWVAFFSTVLFCGLRREEASKLNWSDFDLSRGTVHCAAVNAKKKRARIIQLPSNLVSILQARVMDVATGKLRTGKLAPNSQIDEVISETAQKAGIEWKQNYLGHSYCTYGVAAFGFAETAKKAGNSESALRKHYVDERVSREEGMKFFSITL